MELDRCAEFLRAHDNFTIITHRRPDGDTLGSAAALCHALRRLGKTAWLFPNKGITETYLPWMEGYQAPEGYTGEVFVCVDVAGREMLCRGYDGRVDLWLDHHLDRGEPRENAVVWPDKASCGELVLELIERLGLAIDKEEADLLYIAVSTDTGCFLHGNTTAETHRAAAKLLDAGADLPRINKRIFVAKRRSRLKLEGLIYDSLESFRDGAINVAYVTLEMMRLSGATEDDCEDIANLAGQIPENRVGITVRELTAEPPRCKVSLRTDGAVDASLLCARFGGGGHRMAAGCDLPLPPRETAEAIRAAVEEAWA